MANSPQLKILLEAVALKLYKNRYMTNEVKTIND
jgi:hypothetical protein